MEYANMIFIYLCIGWFVLYAVLLIYLYVKNFKPYKPQFNLDFYTELPSAITPIELSDLMYKKIMPAALSAAVIDLFNDGIIKLVNDKGEDYICIDRINARDYSVGQDYTVKLLINIIGDGNRVSINEIYKFCDRKKNCDVFLMEYNIWVRIMRKENFKHIFYETKNQYGMVKFVTVLGCALFIANIAGQFRTMIGYVTLIPAIFILLYFTKIYKRTREANEEYHKWVAFKQFLENIENFQYVLADPDKYVMYGTVLGVKGLEKKITNHEYFDRIAEAVNRCVVRAILNGNRKIL